MNKALMVVWESRKQNKYRSVTTYHSAANAEKMAAVIRSSQKRKVDVIPLTPENLRRLQD